MATYGVGRRKAENSCDQGIFRLLMNVVWFSFMMM